MSLDSKSSLLSPEINKIINVKDNFTSFDPKIWSAKKLENDRLVFSNENNLPFVTVNLLPGDKTEIGNSGISERSELMEKRDIQLPSETNVWYGFLFKFPKNFQIDYNRLVFAQWKQKIEAPLPPFLSWRYIDGKLIFLVAGENDFRQKFSQEIDLRGEVHQAVVNYQLNPDKESFANAWLDGQPFAQYQGKMGYPIEGDNLTYFKMGLYRDHVDYPSSISLSRFRRGASLKDINS